jgi:hypothetical protein
MQMLKHKQLAFPGLLSFGILVVFVSCYPSNPISVTEADTVTTFKEKNASFANKQSYARPDSVQFIDKGGDSDGDHQYDDDILQAIDRNMQAMGYNKVDDPDQADLHVLPMATTTEWQSAGCYPSWWCSWWYCYPGWCYPYTYNYTTGTILVAMLDPAQAAGSEDITALWLAGINGVLSSGVDTKARIDSHMDQAFQQSPYLKEGK